MVIAEDVANRVQKLIAQAEANAALRVLSPSVRRAPYRSPLACCSPPRPSSPLVGQEVQTTPRGPLPHPIAEDVHVRQKLDDVLREAREHKLRADRAEAELNKCLEQLESRDFERLASQIVEREQETARYKSEVDLMKSALATQESAHLTVERDAHLKLTMALQERDAVQGRYEELVAKHRSLESDVVALQSENFSLQNKLAKLGREYAEALAQLSTLRNLLTEAQSNAAVSSSNASDALLSAEEERERYRVVLSALNQCQRELEVARVDLAESAAKLTTLYTSKAAGTHLAMLYDHTLVLHGRSLEDAAELFSAKVQVFVEAWGDVVLGWLHKARWEYGELRERAAAMEVEAEQARLGMQKYQYTNMHLEESRMALSCKVDELKAELMQLTNLTASLENKNTRMHDDLQRMEEEYSRMKNYVLPECESSRRVLEEKLRQLEEANTALRQGAAHHAMTENHMQDEKQRSAARIAALETEVEKLRGFLTVARREREGLEERVKVEETKVRRLSATVHDLMENKRVLEVERVVMQDEVKKMKHIMEEGEERRTLLERQLEGARQSSPEGNSKASMCHKACQREIASLHATIAELGHTAATHTQGVRSDCEQQIQSLKRSLAAALAESDLKASDLSFAVASESSMLAVVWDAFTLVGEAKLKLQEVKTSMSDPVAVETLVSAINSFSDVRKALQAKLEKRSMPL
eukprot:Sspe_Gene.36259::Locus_17547_Transcript_1_1_Confidence_1.000_Length_2874::g.36259::m.36259